MLVSSRPPAVATSTDRTICKCAGHLVRSDDSPRPASDQASFCRIRRSGSTRGQFQLEQQIGNVAFDGELAHEELCADAAIAQPGSHQLEHFYLAGCQAISYRIRTGRRNFVSLRFEQFRYL